MCEIQQIRGDAPLSGPFHALKQVFKINFQNVEQWHRTWSGYHRDMFIYLHEDKWSHSRITPQRLCSLSVQSFLIPCSSYFLHCKSWYCNPRLAKEFFLKNQSAKIHSYTHHTDVCIAWVLWNTPSQANFKASLCHHGFFQLWIII